MKKSLETVLPEFDVLPDDHFGVLVENEMDARRLLWLVNQIGEVKLRKSAAKRNKYYPDSPLFVSVILKRFNLKVPSEVYTEKYVPIYWVYILVLCDHSAIKIGMTGNLAQRPFAFVKTANYAENFDKELKNLIDLNKSQAFLAESKKHAKMIEDAVKRDFAHLRTQSPYERGLIPYHSRTHTEWFEYSAYPAMTDYLSPLGEGKTLRTSLAWQALMSEMDTTEFNA